MPNKALLPICDVPMIAHVAIRACLAETLDEVIVCTDSVEIADCCFRYGIDVCLTGSYHTNGTERIAQAARILGLGPRDIVVDIQGDEPLVHPEFIDEVSRFLINSEYGVVVPYQLIGDYGETNRVKIVESNGRVLYFSRLDIPFAFSSSAGNLKKHLSIVGFRIDPLSLFANSPRSNLEEIEGVELMRMLELGVPVGTFLQKGSSLSVDVRSDYERVRRLMEKDPIFGALSNSGAFRET